MVSVIPVFAALAPRPLPKSSLCLNRIRAGLSCRGVETVREVGQRRIPSVAVLQPRLQVPVEQLGEQALALGHAVAPELRGAFVMALVLLCCIHGWCFPLVLFLGCPTAEALRVVNKKPPPGFQRWFLKIGLCDELEDFRSTAGVANSDNGGNRDVARYRCLGSHGNCEIHSVVSHYKVRRTF